MATEMVQTNAIRNERQVTIFILLTVLWEVGSESIQYSVLEETDIGTCVANLTRTWDCGAERGLFSGGAERVCSCARRRRTWC